MTSQIKATKVDQLILGDCAKLVPTYIYRGLLRHKDYFEVIYIDQDCMRSMAFNPDRVPYYSYNVLNANEDYIDTALVIKVAATISHSLLDSKLIFLTNAMPAKLSYDIFIGILTYDNCHREQLVADYLDTPAKTAAEFKHYFVETYTRAASDIFAIPSAPVAAGTSLDK